MLKPDEMVDQFRVLRLLGQGGMGEVYLARDTVLGRKVALKVVNATHLGSAKSIQRFLFEARTTAQFNHPHIVTVFAAGEHQGNPYIALEYLEGQSLRQRMREQWPSLRESMRFGLAIAEALQEAHRHNVLHRDLKPENVLIPRDGRLRVVDFGLAKAIGEEALASVESRALHRAAPDQVTQSSLEDLDTIDEASPQRHSPRRDAEPAGDDGDRIIVGTPAYISPERWQQLPSDQASDIWALGVILFELLTGRRPYTDRDAAPLAFKVTSPEPVPLVTQFAELPRDVGELVSRCLAKDPRQRISAVEVVSELERMISRRRNLGGDERSPFRGLLPFGERHADFFFGRDAEIAAFVERLREDPVLPVVGPSGAGKSSFVQAGVVPRLREQGSWLVLSMRPGNQPFATLAARLVAGEASNWSSSSVDVQTFDQRPRQRDHLSSSGFDPRTVLQASDERELARQLAQTPQQLSLVLHRMAEQTGSRVLLFIDQLEELYTLVEDERLRPRFMQAICTAADDPLAPVRVVFTLRDDFLGRVAMGAEVREALSRVTVVRSPAPTTLEEILLLPLQVTGYEVDDANLLKEMVSSVQNEPACLPLLQFAIQMLWERRDRKRRLLRRAHYEAMGGVEGALAEHADGVLTGLSTEQVRFARQLLLRFVTSEGTRCVLPRAQALQGLPTAAADVLDRLTAARLLSVRKGGRDEDSETSLELVHESLIRSWGRLARWVDEGREEIAFLHEVGQAADLWEKRGRRDEEVWRGAPLRDAQRARSRCTAPVPSSVQQFLVAGQRLERRAQRRKRLAVAALAVVAVTAAVMAAAFFEQKNEARRRSAELRVQWAEAQREGARAALLREDFIEARAKLRASLESQDSALGRALWWSLRHNPLQWRVQLETQVYDVTFSPDGATVAAACQDKTVHLFDVETASNRVLRGSDDQVVSLAFSPDGKRLAGGSGTGQIRVWDLTSGAVKLLDGHKAAVWGVAFSPDGAQLASASWDKTVRLWDVDAAVHTSVLQGHTDSVWSVSYSPDGKLLASTSSDRTIRLWEISGGRASPNRVLTGHAKEVAAARFSRDGKRLVSASYDATLRVWDVTTGAQLLQLLGHQDRVRDVCFGLDDKTLISGSSDGTIRIWDATTGVQRRVLEGHTAAVSGLSVSPNGRRLVSGGYDNSVRLWRLDDEVTLPVPQGHSAGAYAVAFSPDDTRVASSSYDKSIRLWDIASGRQMQVLQGHTDYIFGLSYSPDGTLLASSSYDKNVRIWDLKTGTTRAVLEGHTAMVDGVDFSPDGRRIASGSSDRTVRLWNVATGRVEKVLKGHTGWVTGVDFSPDGKLLASGGFDNVVRLWDLAKGKQVRVLSGHEAEVYGVAFSPDGRLLATGGGDKILRVFEVHNGQSRELGRHDGRIYRLAWSPDGKWIGTSSADGTARLWPLAGGAAKVLRGHRTETNGIAYSPNGLLVATTGDDATVRLWNARNGQPVWRGPAMLAGAGVTFSHAGWRHLDGTRVAKETGWQRAIADHAQLVAESSDGTHLCLLGFDGGIELWQIATDQRLFQARLDEARLIESLGTACVVATPRLVRILDSHGGATDLPLEASALGSAGDELLVAAGRKVFTFAADGSPRASFDADVGVTAVLRTATWLVLGFAEGGIELVPLDKAQGARSSFSFESVPSSAVVRLVEGPLDTLLVGYANGALGIWNIQNGKQLYQTRIHGPVRHLVLSSHALYAGSELGAFLSVDLDALDMPYCTLLRSVWDSVGVVWIGGLPLRSPPSPDHACALPP
ncbi:MAG: protein kinase [Pseudomonadota bacterium]